VRMRRAEAEGEWGDVGGGVASLYLRLDGGAAVAHDEHLQRVPLRRHPHPLNLRAHTVTHPAAPPWATVAPSPPHHHPTVVPPPRGGTHIRSSPALDFRLVHDEIIEGRHFNGTHKRSHPLALGRIAVICYYLVGSIAESHIQERTVPTSIRSRKRHTATMLVRWLASRAA
jgi:hypothetical protein